VSNHGGQASHPHGRAGQFSHEGGDHRDGLGQVDAQGKEGGVPQAADKVAVPLEGLGTGGAAAENR